jgi:hypothetical protein
VLDQQDADVPLDVDALDELGERALLGGVGAGGRLVEEQYARIGAERPCDLELALLAVGE